MLTGDLDNDIQSLLKESESALPGEQVKNLYQQRKEQVERLYNHRIEQAKADLQEELDDLSKMYVACRDHLDNLVIHFASGDVVRISSVELQELGFTHNLTPYPTPDGTYRTGSVSETGKPGFGMVRFIDKPDQEGPEGIRAALPDAAVNPSASKLLQAIEATN